MPAFGWLAKNPADAAGVADKMRALRKVGVPYTDEEIAGASKEVEGKTELDVLVAYLRAWGLNSRGSSKAMDINDLRSIVTVVSFATFLGIIWWAYGVKSNRQRFEEAAELALRRYGSGEAGTLAHCVMSRAANKGKNHERFCQ